MTEHEIDDDVTGVLVREVPPDGPQPGHAERALRRRRKSNERVLAIGLAALALVALVSFWAGSKVHGGSKGLPKNVAQPIPTTPIRWGRLVSELETAGTVVRGGERQVTPLPSNLDGAQPIVTRLPLHSGSRLTEGRVVAEVAGRPTMVLRGTIPMYRDLSRGAQGADVAQFQQALDRLGYSVDDRVGRFGPSTAAAAVALFRDRAYDLRAEGRVGVPGSSVVYLARFPAFVARVFVRVGELVHGPLLSVSAGAPRIRAAVDPAQTASIRRGMRATAFAGSRSLRARVAGVGSAGSVTLVAPSARRRLRVGEAVRVTIRLGSSRSAVWSVPFSAVFTAPDGGTFVRVRVRANHWRRVPVTLGYSANGYVAIRPRAGSRVRAGQPVAVAG